MYLGSTAADALEEREMKCERVKVGSVVTRCVPWFSSISRFMVVCLA